MLLTTVDGYTDQELAYSFMCGKMCPDTPGINQLILQINQEYKVIESLTPDQKVLLKGKYKVDKNNLILISDEKAVRFNIETGYNEICSKKIMGKKLIFHSGQSNYFKEGMVFFETAPFMYGIQSSCVDKFGKLKKSDDCKPCIKN